MLDHSKIGYRFPAFSVQIERGRLELFARAIGETNPVYLDAQAASSAGYRNIPAPPTYPFCLGKDIPDPSDTLHLFGLDFCDVVHGEQEFIYYKDICVGDWLTGKKLVMDVYERKLGKLGFIIVKTEFHDVGGKSVCEMTQTIIVTRQSES